MFWSPFVICTRPTYRSGAVTYYAMNLGSTSVDLTLIRDHMTLPKHIYWLTPGAKGLISRYVDPKLGLVTNLYIIRFNFIAMGFIMFSSPLFHSRFTLTRSYFISSFPRYVSLNGKNLKMVNNTTLPQLDPLKLTSNKPIRLPPQSFGFVVIPDAKAEACF